MYKNLLVLLSFLQLAFSDYGELEVIGISHNLVSLRWYKPIPNANIRLYDYTFLATEGPVSGPDLTKNSFCQDEICYEDVENLRSCVKYEISLKATYRNGGTFDYPKVINETMESTPSAPENLVQVSLKSGKVELNWKPPEKYPECVSFYKVCYVKVPETKSSNYKCLYTPFIDPMDWYNEITFTVSDLEPCAEYRFSIRGITESGTESPEAATLAKGEFEEPSEPLNLKVNAVVGNEVSLCWEDPITNPLCVDSYAVLSHHCDPSDPAGQSNVMKVTREDRLSSNGFEVCENKEIVGELLYCTCYDFHVVSVKHDGTFMKESNHDSSTTDFAEGGLEAPVSVEVQGFNNTYALISWFAPPENFNCITGYETTWTDGVTMDSVIAPSKYNFTQELVNLLPCQSYNVTVETLPSGPLTLSPEKEFSTSNIAPEKAENVVVFDVTGYGFIVSWTNPSRNPQCAKFWSRDITDITSSVEESGEIECEVREDFTPPPGSNLYEADELQPNRIYRLTLVGFPSFQPEFQGESYSCIVSTTE